MMKLEYAAPPADLAEFVSAYYLFVGDDDGGLDDLERASIAQIRLTYSGEGELCFPRQPPQPIPPLSLIGPRTSWSRITGRGNPIRVFGIGLLPAGWAADTRLGADQWVNRVVPLKTVFGKSAQSFADCMAPCTTLDEMVAAASAFARPHFQKANANRLEFVRALNRWLETDLVPDIDVLAQTVGLSRRQVERLAKQYYGAPPKYLVRMYRALRAANAIANGRGDWQDFVTGAFYDQSHFIREIKHFTGLTPGAVREHASRLTQLAFGRAQLAGQVGSLIANS